MSFPLSFTIEDIEKNISHTYLSRGREYLRQGRVKEWGLSADGRLLTGRVKGSLFNAYEIAVEFGNGGNYGVQISGDCTCPIGFNCKHVAAVLLACLANRPGLFTGREKEKDIPRQPDKPKEEKGVVDHFTANWLKKLELAASPVSANTYPPTVKQRLLYLLDLKRKTEGIELVVSPATGNIKMDGSFGSWKSMTP